MFVSPQRLRVEHVEREHDLINVYEDIASLIARMSPPTRLVTIS
jgi:hypothetical protein